MAVLSKFLTNELRFGLRSILSLVVLFLGEPLCQFMIKGPGGVAGFAIGCLLVYSVLPASHLPVGNKAVLITGNNCLFIKDLIKCRAVVDPVGFRWPYPCCTWLVIWSKLTKKNIPDAEPVTFFVFSAHQNWCHINRHSFTWAKIRKMSLDLTSDVNLGAFLRTYSRGYYHTCDIFLGHKVGDLQFLGGRSWSKRGRFFCVPKYSL